MVERCGHDPRAARLFADAVLGQPTEAMKEKMKAMVSGESFTVTLTPVKDEEFPAFVSWRCPECESGYIDVMENADELPKLVYCDCGVLLELTRTEND